jgi:3-hydroxyacyl-CoA dehydrogenase
VDQQVEHLPSKHEVLSSNSSTIKINKSEANMKMCASSRA